MIFDQVAAVTSPIVTAVVLKKARRLLLDIYGGANAAYSLRAISEAWRDRDVVEVRRASDDTTRGFTADDIGDGTLTNWVGTGATDHGYVATWYDQSGNGNDAVQPVTQNQPKIIEGGVLVADGLKFDGVDDYLYNAALTTSSAADTVAIVGTINANGGAFIDSHNGGNANPRYIGYTAGDAEFAAYYSNTTDYTYGAYNSNQNLHFIVKSQYGSLNGVTDALNSGSATLNGIRIGISRLMGVPLGGSVQEVIIYDSDQSSNRTGIEGNINDYYEIFADETYRRPDGSAIFRPDGTSVYERP